MAKRVVWLGDSITYSGEWGEWVETWVRLRFPNSDIQFINLGLPSETASGLSEAGHAGGAFPRPDIHERLGRLLEKVKPDLVPVLGPLPLWRSLPVMDYGRAVVLAQSPRYKVCQPSWVKSWTS